LDLRLSNVIVRLLALIMLLVLIPAFLVGAILVYIDLWGDNKTRILEKFYAIMLPFKQ